MNIRFPSAFSHRLIPLMLLIAATIAIYGRILSHEFLWIWDDNFYVTGNPDAWGVSWENIKASFSTYYLGNYAPVQIISYMLDFTFWGLNPQGYLLTNIFLHLMNGLLVYHLSSKFLDNRAAALFSAAIFMLHPVQVETVAWISQRKNLLSLLFLLLSWEGYCRYRDASTGHSRLAYILSIIAFICSLLAKSMTVIFPVILLLQDVCFPSGNLQKRYLDKIPYVLAAVVVAIVAIYSERPDVGGGGRTGFHGGSPWATFLTMIPVFCMYIKMLIWPVNLSAEYAPAIHTSLDAVVMLSGLLLLLVAAGGFLLWKHDRRLGFWAGFFWIGLLPLSQVVPMLSMINDRYLYMPIIGVAAIGGTALVKARSTHNGKFSSIVNVAAVFILVLMSLGSFKRVDVWQNSVSLFGDVVRKTPSSDRGWALLADAYKNAGNPGAAIRTYEKALRYNPVNTFALAGLGSLYTEHGNLETGNRLLQKLLEIQPEHAAGWVMIGDNRLKRNDYAGADKAYRKALEIQPQAFSVYLHLGNLALLRGNPDEARILYHRVDDMDPSSAEVAYRLACLESSSGRTQEALAWLAKALQRGYNNYLELNSNKQLEKIWDEPRFAMLILQYFPEQVNQ